MSTAREFFVDESREYLERIRSLLLEGRIDAHEFHRLCRALRGSAQMARELEVCSAARVLESAAREAADGRLEWSEQARRHADATVDDLWALIEEGEADEAAAAALDRVARVRERWHELGVAVEDDDFAAAAAGAPSTDAYTDDPSAVTPAFIAYVAREVEAIVAEARLTLQRLEEDPMDRAPLSSLVERQGPLLGAAGLGALPAIGDALETMDQAARTANREGRAVEGEWLEIFRRGVAALEDALVHLREGRAPPEEGPRLEELRSVRDSVLEDTADEGAGAERAEEEIPLEVVNFFRTESRSHLEKLGRLVEELAGDSASEERLREQMRESLASLASTARTFGFAGAASQAESASARLQTAAATELAPLLAFLEDSITAELYGPRPRPARAAGEPVAALVEPASDEQVVEAAAAGELLRSGAPPPVSMDAEGVVPIEDLCYRGESALRRALELRADLDRRLDPAADREVVDELFDLIRLGLR